MLELCKTLSRYLNALSKIVVFWSQMKESIRKIFGVRPLRLNPVLEKKLILKGVEVALDGFVATELAFSSLFHIKKPKIGIDRLV